MRRASNDGSNGPHHTVEGRQPGERQPANAAHSRMEAGLRVTPATTINTAVS
jgi:hypothetical protein